MHFVGRGSRLAVLAITFAIVLTACASATTSTSSGGGGGGGVTNGGMLRIGTTGQIDSLNPFVGYNSDDYNIWEYEYPTLIQYDTRTLNFIPDFATSWKTSSDGLSWTFNTVPNAKWSDGQPLDANSVAWFFNTVLKYASGPASLTAGYMLHMKNAVATGPNTVVVNYKVPVANVLAQLEGVYILPEQVWGKFATGDGKGLRQFNNQPQNGQPVVSGGPFMMTKYTVNQVASFTVNPNWYGPKPHISGFGLAYFATDDSIVQALETNQIDVIWSPVPTTAIGTLKKAGFVVSVTPGATFDELNINSNPLKTTNKELQNPLVKEAISHAIDYKSIVDTAWNGYAQTGASLVPPASGIAPGTGGKPWTDPSIKTPTFDISLANQELDQAGYPMGPNGYRIANGHPMQYTVIVPHASLGSGMSALQIIQGDLKQVGIGITPKVLNDGAAWAAETANHYTSYDMSIWSWGAGIDPDFILSVLTRAQWYNWSDAAYNNPQYNNDYNLQGTQINPMQRLQTVYAMQQMVFKDKPFIVLNYEDNRIAWSSKWTGFVPSPLGEFSFLSKQSLLEAHQVG